MTRLTVYVYLDHHASTPVDPRVLERMLPYFGAEFGNPASSHAWGQRAARAVELARAAVAALIGAQPLEVIFTSGATESVNLALKGLVRAGERRRTLITARSEHPAVLDCCEWLSQQGLRIAYLDLDSKGHIDLNQLRELLDDEVLCVSLMYANNEIGVLHDVAAIGALAHEHGAFFHCDATQAVGRERVDVVAQNIDLLSLSGHKLYGPKGVGALYVRRKAPRVRLEALLHGGGQERGLRSGTLNVPAIVGLGEACALAAAEAADERVRLRGLRERFWQALAPAGPLLAGDPERRLAGNLNLRFPGVRAADLMRALPEVAISSGSACSEVARRPSRTLIALGLSPAQAGEHLRFGLGRFTTAAELDWVAARILAEVAVLRSREDDCDVCTL